MLRMLPAAAVVPDKNLLLTPRQVEDLIGCSRSTVNRLAAAGRLERLYLGHRTVRYTPESVTELIETLKAEKAPADA